MSVINQMLKDLEQRQGEHQAANSPNALPVAEQKSHYKTAFLIVITIIITLIAVYGFQLRDENQRLKNDNLQKQVQKNETAAKGGQPVVTAPIHDGVEQTQTFVNEQLAPVAIKVSAGVSSAQPEKQQEPLKQEAIANADSKKSDIPTAKISTQPVVVKTAAKVNLIAKPVVKTQGSSSMVVSRKHLEPEELAKQKMTRAKRALENNEVSKAEQLFEDVLIVTPNNKDARKQLAALWFGRQSYQAAVNVLSQGIGLDPQDKELRILQAQIYSKQNANYQAYKALESHPNLSSIDDVNYQSMLATQAQASKQYDGAIAAYKRLTIIQPNAGRWWLGLGIAYDSSSQFKSASQSYQMAMNKLNLSDSAKQFVSQRLIELGE